jgi:hypothetical protein
MAIFTATFSAVAVTAAQDVFEIVAPSNARVRIHEITLGQYSDFGDAAAEILSVTILRGHTTSGSGGSSVTPSNMSGTSGASSATATVEANNTTVATGGSPATLRAESWNIQVPWLHIGDSNFILETSQRLVIRITVPADSLTMNGTLVFEEIAV